MRTWWVPTLVGATVSDRPPRFRVPIGTAVDIGDRWLDHGHRHQLPLCLTTSPASGAHELVMCGVLLCGGSRLYY